MTSHHPIRKVVPPGPPVIPDKLYFRIGDVAKLCAVPAYVLRFWETEFPQLKPNKGGTGQRLYRRRDVEIALRIKSLLYEQGYTIAGARQVFAAESRATETKSKESAESAPQAASMARPFPAAERLPEEHRPPEAMGLAGSGNTGLDGRDESRRRDKLLALRDELRELAGLLAQPMAPAAVRHADGNAAGEVAGEAAGATPGEAGTTAAKAKILRPRLVVEAKAEAKPGVRHGDQGDLFASE